MAPATTQQHTSIGGRSVLSPHFCKGYSDRGHASSRCLDAPPAGSRILQFSNTAIAEVLGTDGEGTAMASS